MRVAYTAKKSVNLEMKCVGNKFEHLIRESRLIPVSHCLPGNLQKVIFLLTVGEITRKLCGGKKEYLGLKAKII